MPAPRQEADPLTASSGSSTGVHGANDLKHTASHDEEKSKASPLA